MKERVLLIMSCNETPRIHVSLKHAKGFFKSFKDDYAKEGKNIKAIYANIYQENPTINTLDISQLEFKELKISK